MIALIKFFIFPIIDDFQSQIMIEYLQFMLLLVFISVAVFVIVATPMMLFYITVDNFHKWKMNKKLITNDLCCDNKSHSSYISEICRKHKKFYTNFISSFFGLFSWNLFSILYIGLEFSNFKTGILNYFLFPFKVLESFNINFSKTTFYEFKTQGVYMIMIFFVSLIFYQLGRYLAEYLIKNNLSFNLKGKLFTVSSQLKSTFLNA